jgi:hypothetical protein
MRCVFALVSFVFFLIGTACIAHAAEPAGEIVDRFISQKWIFERELYEGGSTACRLKSLTQDNKIFTYVDESPQSGPEAWIEGVSVGEENKYFTVSIFLDNERTTELLARIINNNMFIEWPNNPDLLAAMQVRSEMRVNAPGQQLSISLNGANPAILKLTECVVGHRR